MPWGIRAIKNRVVEAAGSFHEAFQYDGVVWSEAAERPVYVDWPIRVVGCHECAVASKRLARGHDDTGSVVCGNHVARIGHQIRMSDPNVQSDEDGCQDYCFGHRLRFQIDNGLLDWGRFRRYGTSRLLPRRQWGRQRARILGELRKSVRTAESWTDHLSGQTIHQVRRSIGYRVAQTLGPIDSDKPGRAGIAGNHFNVRSLWPGYKTKREWQDTAREAECIFHRGTANSGKCSIRQPQQLQTPGRSLKPGKSPRGFKEILAGWPTTRLLPCFPAVPEVLPADPVNMVDDPTQRAGTESWREDANSLIVSHHTAEQSTMKR